MGMMPPRRWCGFVPCLLLQDNTSFVRNLSKHKMWGLFLRKLHKIWDLCVTFLSLNKKVTKEVSIGKALMSRSRAPNTPFPMYLSRGALPMLRSKVLHINEELPARRREG